MHIILQAVVPLFALIFAGYLAGRYRVLGAYAADSLNRFVAQMALPVLLFQAMAQISWEEINQPGYVASFGLATLAVFFLAYLHDRRRGARMTDAAIDALTGSYANAGFMGIPLGIMLFGRESLPPVVMSTLMTACALFALTIALVEFDRQGPANLGQALRKVALSLVRSPLVVAPLAGLVVAAAGWTLPGPILQFTTQLGAAAAPCALISIGLFLAQSPVTGPIEPIVWRMVALKLILHPLLVFVLVTWVFTMPPMWAQIAVLLAALPIGSGPFMLAKLYDCRATSASRAILISTVLSLFTVSLLVAWMRTQPT